MCNTTKRASTEPYMVRAASLPSTAKTCKWRGRYRHLTNGLPCDLSARTGASCAAAMPSMLSPDVCICVGDMLSLPRGEHGCELPRCNSSREVFPLLEVQTVVEVPLRKGSRGHAAPAKLPPA